MKSKIATIRKAKGYKQKQLAKLIGVLPSVVCRWEKGIFKPSAEHLIALAAALECSPADLI